MCSCACRAQSYATPTLAVILIDEIIEEASDGGVDQFTARATVTPIADYVNGQFIDHATGTAHQPFQEGIELTVLRRGQVVGTVLITQQDVYPGIDRPITARGEASLDPQVRNIMTFLAVTQAPSANPSGFRPANITAELINKYSKYMRYAGSIAFKAREVPENIANRNKPMTFNIFTPDMSAPIMLAGSLTIPYDTEECATVYHTFQCTEHTLFTVLKEKDKKIKPVILSYVAAGDFSTQGWETFLDVVDVDDDGDGDLVTRLLDSDGFRNRIYFYDNEKYTAVFESEHWEALAGE